MKCPLGISDFLEEISSLSHSVVFLYFFALIPEEGFLISSCYSLELCIQMLISFLFSFAFHFSLFLPFCSLGIPWAQSSPVTEVNLCLLFLQSSPQAPLSLREPLAQSLVPSATQSCVFILLWYSSRFPSNCIMYKGPQVTRSVSSLFPSEVPSERLPESESCSVVPDSATPWII